MCTTRGPTLGAWNSFTIDGERPFCYTPPASYTRTMFKPCCSLWSAGNDLGCMKMYLALNTIFQCHPMKCSSPMKYDLNITLLDKPSKTCSKELHEGQMLTTLFSANHVSLKTSPFSARIYKAANTSKINLSLGIANILPHLSKHNNKIEQQWPWRLTDCILLEHHWDV